MCGFPIIWNIRNNIYLEYLLLNIYFNLKTKANHLNHQIVLLVGAVEYTDCTSADG